ncbi:hypothetical protein PIB30_004670 [Stylosanthes scabra]|uniref:Uncharacterized protein n=1 Tax=Stylosanthes scabra TaxID=79078 RepID=A0ABU6Q4T1_9FABA|nr:hypothetical protein [Stylosanthes scabra]
MVFSVLERRGRLGATVELFLGDFKVTGLTVVTAPDIIIGLGCIHYTLGVMSFPDLAFSVYGNDGGVWEQRLSCFRVTSRSRIDPELLRTVIVSTKLNTRIPQFARSSDVEVFLSLPACTLDGCILGDSPFFKSVPSGIVGSGSDSVYWSNNEFKQIDPELSRTVIVSTKLDTRIPQFAPPSDVEVFLSLPASTLDGCILGDSPFFKYVPSGRVGSGSDSVYRSNDEFKQEKLGRSLSKQERNGIGVSKLRLFLEELLKQRYINNVPLIIPLLEKEYRNATRKLSDINQELSSLDEVKLKEKGRTFNDQFLTKICVWCWHHIMEMSEKDGT